MNKLILATLIAFGAGTASAQSTGASLAPPDAVRSQADGTHASISDNGYAAYRRAVLGDTRIDTPSVPNSADGGGRWVPGSYALYLMHNGMAKAAALDQAQRIGEVPSYRDATSARGAMQLTSYELYQRSVLGRSESEIALDRAGMQRWESPSGVASQAPR